MIKNPKFFISSTIKDFKDLRSSIKWWLEENNYTVNASEYNDFEKPIDENSYEACLQAIDNSDYFILLIGNRNGGMYDDQITITQMEYRHAYQRMLSGKLKIINFVRQDTWANFFDSRDKIKLLEKDSTIDEPTIKKLFTDEERIRYAFIDEVRRVDEMKKGKKPKNNWIHSFNTFSDIVSVFRIELGSRSNLTFKQNRFIILSDIKRNLKTICSKMEGEIFPIGFMSRELWKEYRLDMDVLQINVSKEQYINYASFYISCLQIRTFRSNRIESFYKMGFFLEYNNSQDDFISGELNQMATNLLDSYERLNNLHKSIYKNSGEKLVSLRKKADNSHRKVTSIEILFALDFYDEMRNCIELSKNLYKALKGLDYSVPKLIQHERRPKNMIPKEEEIVSETDILKFLTE